MSIQRPKSTKISDRLQKIKIDKFDKSNDDFIKKYVYHEIGRSKILASNSASIYFPCNDFQSHTIFMLHKFQNFTQSRWKLLFL